MGTFSPTLKKLAAGSAAAALLSTTGCATNGQIHYPLEGFLKPVFNPQSCPLPGEYTARPNPVANPQGTANWDFDGAINVSTYYNNCAYMQVTKALNFTKVISESQYKMFQSCAGDARAGQRGSLCQRDSPYNPVGLFYFAGHQLAVPLVCQPSYPTYTLNAATGAYEYFLRADCQPAPNTGYGYR